MKIIKNFSAIALALVLICNIGIVGFAADNTKAQYNSMTDEQLFELALKGVYVDTEEVVTKPIDYKNELQMLSGRDLDEYDTFAVQIERKDTAKNTGTATLYAQIIETSSSTVTNDYVLRLSCGYTYESEANMRIVKTFFGQVDILDGKFWVNSLTINCGTGFGFSTQTITSPTSGRRYTYDHPYGREDAVHPDHISVGVDVTYARSSLITYTETFIM